MGTWVIYKKGRTASSRKIINWAATLDQRKQLFSHHISESRNSLLEVTMDSRSVNEFKGAGKLKEDWSIGGS